jgi:signal transduction histidine kinase
VISDTQGELVGSVLTSVELANGAPISVRDSLVGILIVSPSGLSGTNSLTEQFLASVNQSILISVAVAGGIALLLGALFFLQITAPLRKLKQAASAIASGDLRQRVAVKSRDELGELGHTFNQMAENLDLAETRRQRLVADVAHELRTPLAVMQANLEGMIDGVLPLDLEQVEAVHTETLLLTRLVGDLRLLSLAESGELKLERSPANLGRLVDQVCERIQPQAAQKGIKLQVEIQDHLSEVNMDTDRITQVLTNLIHNALNYTPRGGEITVKAVLDTTQPGAAAVSVTDTGPGIAVADLPFVFDRFYRADRSRTRASGGSGLGLAIVRQLVEAHGGKVKAESPVFHTPAGGGFGTRILFNLPFEVLTGG